jgi:alpha-tubulin suppressor-like RCC1 family protein
VGNAAGTMGDALSVIDVGTSAAVASVSIAYNFMCALLANSTAKCWGRNNVGNLGLADTASRGDGPSEMGDNLPTIMLPGANITSIHTGDTSSVWRHNQSRKHFRLHVIPAMGGSRQLN